MMRSTPTFFLAGGLLLAAMLLASPMAGAEETASDPHLTRAIELRAQAISAFGSGDYDAAALLARLAKAELALIKTVVPAAKTESAPPVVEVTELPTATPLPASYTVRFIPGDRDCLSKIADYPFVYGDRSKWTELYKANKGSLRHPENADFILPGEVIFIPSIAGEIREGSWEEEQLYPSFSAVQ